jgi:hypothetical protein
MLFRDIIEGKDKVKVETYAEESAASARKNL